MEKVLDKLLKDIYTVEALEESLITADTKTKSPKPPNGKPFSSGPELITPDISSFERLEAAVEKLPVVFITLAVDLPTDKGENDEIAKLGRWFRQNVDRRILLELRHDPQILGGCVLIWKGVEGDFSLRAKLKRNREESTPE